MSRSTITSRKRGGSSEISLRIKSASKRCTIWPSAVSYQHSVKPWFNGRLDIAPPVPDLDSQNFTLVGGRLDCLEGRAAAAIVYRRRAHTINLFVTEISSRTGDVESVHGFNIYSFTEQGLNLWAVSDINADELREFGQKFRAAIDPGGGA
jgi:anti-sigma factor RsiW